MVTPETLPLGSPHFSAFPLEDKGAQVDMLEGMDVKPETLPLGDLHLSLCPQEDQGVQVGLLGGMDITPEALPMRPHPNYICSCAPRRTRARRWTCWRGVHVTPETLPVG